MKKWKRLFSLVCAFAMIFSLNTTAFAAELPKTDTKQQYEITVGDEAITLEACKKGLHKYIHADLFITYFSLLA